jgi:hypothetical protein
VLLPAPCHKSQQAETGDQHRVGFGFGNIRQESVGTCERATLGRKCLCHEEIGGAECRDAGPELEPAIIGIRLPVSTR